VSERTYEFDVDVSTYDELHRGVSVADRRRVVVLADSDVDAFYSAYYLAAVDGVEVTDVWWRY
jgi:hypothetical protein